MAKVEPDINFPPVKIIEFPNPKTEEKGYKSVNVSLRDIPIPEQSVFKKEDIDDIYKSDMASPGIIPVSRTSEYEIQSESNFKIEKESKIKDLVKSWNLEPFISNARLVSNMGGLNLFTNLLILKDEQKKHEMENSQLTFDEVLEYIIKTYTISTTKEE